MPGSTPSLRNSSGSIEPTNVPHRQMPATEMPITQPSLGLLIANGFKYIISGRYWISTFPGIALLITIVSINLVGDRLRDVLNPRLQK